MMPIAASLLASCASNPTPAPTPNPALADRKCEPIYSATGRLHVIGNTCMQSQMQAVVDAYERCFGPWPSGIKIEDGPGLALLKEGGDKYSQLDYECVPNTGGKAFKAIVEASQRCRGDNVRLKPGGNPENPSDMICLPPSQRTEPPPER